MNYIQHVIFIKSTQETTLFIGNNSGLRKKFKLQLTVNILESIITPGFTQTVRPWGQSLIIQNVLYGNIWLG